MNCCDEYGNCNQGRDCPVRKALAEEKAKCIINTPFKEVKISLWARTPTLYKVAMLAALWFLFVYLPSLELK